MFDSASCPENCRSPTLTLLCVGCAMCGVRLAMTTVPVGAETVPPAPTNAAVEELSTAVVFEMPTLTPSETFTFSLLDSAPTLLERNLSLAPRSG